MTTGATVGRVLVIDDVELIRRMLDQMLRDAGYEVLLAADGVDGVRVARETGPDVILLDMTMPRMGGLEVLEELSGDPDLSRVPVLIVSGETGSDEMVAAFERGAHDYITKPFDAEVLKARVTAAWRAKHREDALRDAAERLHGEAMSDALTGLANRRYGEAQLQRLVALSARDGVALSIAKADVDHFKRINDAHGHGAGDRALQDIARCLASRVRTSDIVSRWGGDEFVLLLPGTDLRGAARVAHDIADTIRHREITLESGATLMTTLSVGVAQWSAGPGNRLIAAADEAMYAAKAAGRDCVEPSV